MLDYAQVSKGEIHEKATWMEEKKNLTESSNTSTLVNKTFFYSCYDFDTYQKLANIRWSIGSYTVKYLITA